MSEKNRITELYDSLKLERSEYATKARQAGYKPGIPNMPENNQDYGLLNSTLSGFQKRFGNWKNNFNKFYETKLEEEANY